MRRVLEHRSRRQDDGRRSHRDPVDRRALGLGHHGLAVEVLQDDRIFARDHLLEDRACGKGQSGDILLGELAQIGHPLVVTEILENGGNECGARGAARHIAPDHFAPPFWIEQIVERAWFGAWRDEFGVVGGRRYIHVDGDPTALRIDEIARIMACGIWQKPHCKTRPACLSAVTANVPSTTSTSCRPACASLVIFSDHIGGRIAVVEHVDAVFLFESIRQGASEIVDGLRRIPDHLAFLAGSIDQSGIGSSGEIAAHHHRQDEKQRHQGATERLGQWHVFLFSRRMKPHVPRQGWPDRLWIAAPPSDIKPAPHRSVNRDFSIDGHAASSAGQPGRFAASSGRSNQMCMGSST